MINITEVYHEYFNISPSTAELAAEAERQIAKQLDTIAETVRHNSMKVLNAFLQNKISDSHFYGTTGYGYDDIGRAAIDKVFAQVFGAEDALVRHNIISGTHAIALCLFGVLRPGDELISVTGKPYDTLEKTIGIAPQRGEGSLIDFGVKYTQIDLLAGKVDYDKLEKCLKTGSKTSKKVLFIQKSKGYDYRQSLTCREIGEIVQFAKEINKKEMLSRDSDSLTPEREKSLKNNLSYNDLICIVDNCYGEFVETVEPTEVGADLIAGSLIKNPGGGIAPTGGYIAGRAELVRLASYKLNAVGLGAECGATLGLNKAILQGFFMAPHIVGQALKTSVFAAQLFQNAGFDVLPLPDQYRSDIIQAIKLGREEDVIKFCQAIQSVSPIDSFATPQPADMPGYAHKVIMAAGAFTQGASIELSADAPIKPPYVAYLQGGLTYDYAKIGVMKALQAIKALN